VAFKKGMYPPIKPNKRIFLKVDSLHTLYVEECGNKKGIPTLYLHGGPGGSINSNNRRIFNPRKYRIILFDQRGSGKSKPNKLTKKNTTNDLINDIEKIREKLEIKKWLIVGGSWGSTLGLTYSIKNPNKVLGLILRGVFLGSREETFWAFNDAAKYFYPELINKIENKIKKNKKNNIFQELGKMLDSGNEKKRKIASNIWHNYEGILSILEPGNINILNFFKNISKQKKNPTSPFLEWHYAKNNFFIKKNEIKMGLKRIKNIPTIIIQGRYDLICPPKSAFFIHKNLSNSVLKIIESSGHATSEKKIKSNLIKAINEIYKKIK